MDNNKPLKTIVTAIVDYYEGKEINYICAEHCIEQQMFNQWLETYKYIAIDLVELRLENKKLRGMVVDMILEQKSKFKDR